MARSTITLTQTVTTTPATTSTNPTGSLSGCRLDLLSATSMASATIYVKSGQILLIPYKTSATVWNISCAPASATSKNQPGQIGIPNGANYPCLIKTNATAGNASTINTLRFCSVNIEQVNSGTVTLKGGGA